MVFKKRKADNNATVSTGEMIPGQVPAEKPLTAEMAQLSYSNQELRPTTPVAASIVPETAEAGTPVVANVIRRDDGQFLPTTATLKATTYTVGAEKQAKPTGEAVFIAIDPRRKK